MKNIHYKIKKRKKKFNAKIDYDKLKGFGFLPQNKIKYDGIIVNKMILVKPSMVQTVLKKKIKNRLDLYLKFIINTTNGDDDDGTQYKEALNDLSKYKDVIQYKYMKYLDEKYSNILLKKISYLEYELNRRIIRIELNYNYGYDYEEEIAPRRR